VIDEPGTSHPDASTDPRTSPDGRLEAASDGPPALPGMPAPEATSDGPPALPGMPAPEATSDGPPALPGRPAPDAAPPVADPPAEPLLDLDTATRRALLALPGRSPDPLICPFLRAGDGGLAPGAATGQRCVAVTPAIVLTEHQRQLVCQTAAYPSCPRYTRGEAAVRASLAPGLGRRSRAAPAAIATAAVLVVMAAAVAATSGVVAPNGEGGGAGDGAAEATTMPAGGTGAPPDAASVAPSAGDPGTSGLPAATVAPLATVRPTLAATRDLPLAWRGLKACPAPDTCYLYVVERGDTFSGIAARFETTTKKLRRLNPGLDDPNAIRVRQQLRVPPPD
jgi:hypothetical protein